MALHRRSAVRHILHDEITSSADPSVSMPKFKFPRHESGAAHVYQAVHDELMLDGNSRLNTATFCQTWLEPEIHRLMDECMDKNMIDKDEYPQTAELESRCVHMLADLWNSPEAADTVGCSTTGSSEAAMLGGLAMKWIWRTNRVKRGEPTGRPNMVSGPVQVCWHKFARYFDVELREIPMQPGRLTMNPDDVVKNSDENTIGVVATLGQTFTMQYEPVLEISKALDELQARSGLDIPVHVDAASGGFLVPFLSPDLLWDFRVSRVKSINSSGHKFGLAPLGVGWVIWRESADLPEDLVFRVNYLGGDMPTFALNFSRPGGQVVCQYYNFFRLGREGYRKIQQSCADTGAYLADEIGKLGPFEIIYDGRAGIPGACWKLSDSANPGYSLYDLADRLRSRGWQVPAYSLPPDLEHVVIQRVIVRHGFSRNMARLLVDDLMRCLDYFAGHPVSQSLSASEASGYRH